VVFTEISKKRGNEAQIVLLHFGHIYELANVHREEEVLIDLVFPDPDKRSGSTN
jgi:hypothetical protein